MTGLRGAEWHARIECGGRVSGAGFLVARDTVLTCAHVVQDSERFAVTVTFPQRPGSDPVAARVVAHGGWDDGHGTDLGDLAVLRLDQDMAITPAVLALADTAHSDRKLVAYGFPAGHGDTGTQSLLHTVGPLLVGGEWIELEAWSGHGQPLAVGFSGAAVTLVDSGEVVGMVTAAAGARAVQTGRMMPTHVMARYWPDLAALVPAASSVMHPDGARLRGLVEKAVRAGLKIHPGRLYAEVVGVYDPDPPPEGFGSLRAAAWFVLYEVDDPATATRFADRLETLLDVGPRPADRPEWAPVLVELRHSGAGGLISVEVSAYGKGRCRRIIAETVPQARLRTCVQEGIEAAVDHLPEGTDELIAFALPRDWLDWPVDRWAKAADDPVPLGCAYPLVVTDHVRRKPSTRRTLARAWKSLDASTGVSLHKVGCAGLEAPRQLRLRLWQSEFYLAGFAAAARTAPTRPHFEMSLTAPAPVIMWSRRGCDTAGQHGCADDCTGTAFLSALDSEIAHVTPGELPRRVRALRREADAMDEHWAQDIQLLWDDPRCFTDDDTTTSHVRSPVT
ncbi:trypsin-like peptidase domain-containing protein [Streptomyces chartreusis]|uniref:VMAP-C domain-containing protein n=1 Tax=Streptomyces chartreusis TaxID=1969 RepID=UPI0033DDFBF8